MDNYRVEYSSGDLEIELEGNCLSEVKDNLAKQDIRELVSEVIIKKITKIDEETGEEEVLETNFL